MLPSTAPGSHVVTGRVLVPVPDNAHPEQEERAVRSGDVGSVRDCAEGVTHDVLHGITPEMNDKSALASACYYPMIVDCPRVVSTTTAV